MEEAALKAAVYAFLDVSLKRTNGRDFAPSPGMSQNCWTAFGLALRCQLGVNRQCGWILANGPGMF
jgi:hypothetical protein